MIKTPRFKKSVSVSFSAFLFLFLFLSSCGNDTKKQTTTVDSTAVKIPVELSRLNDSIATDPKNAELLFHRAQYYSNAKDVESGLTDITAAIKIDSSKATYFMLLSDLSFVVNKTSVSKKALEKAIALDPKNVDALLKLAELHLYVKQNQRSIDYINMALKIDMYNSKGYFMKGMNQKELHDTAGAISSMQTAVEQDQQYYNAYMQLGLLCAAKHKKVANDYYKNAIRIQPKSVEAWYDLGKFYQDEGDWNNAIGTYKTLLTFDQNKNAAYNMGVICLLNIKDYPNAVAYFTGAINVDAKFVEAYYGRGLAYQYAKDQKNAVKDFDACLAIDPNFTAAAEALKKMK